METKIGRTIQVFVFTRGETPKFLLLRTTVKKGDFWQPVTGRMEETDNSYPAAARREVMEETNIVDFMRFIDLKRHFSFISHSSGIKYYERAFAIEVKCEKEVKLSDEHSEYAWVDYHQAVEMLGWKEYRKTLNKLNNIIKSGK